MKRFVAAICLTIIAAPAWAWDAPQSGGVAIQPYHATLSPYAQQYLQHQQQGPAPGQAPTCSTEHCHGPAPGTCNTEHCHGTPPAQAQIQAAGRFAKR
jgi:hypothetical protein